MLRKTIVVIAATTIIGASMLMSTDASARRGGFSRGGHARSVGGGHGRGFRGGHARGFRGGHVRSFRRARFRGHRGHGFIVAPSIYESCYRWVWTRWGYLKVWVC